MPALWQVAPADETRGTSTRGTAVQAANASSATHAVEMTPGLWLSMFTGKPALMGLDGSISRCWNRTGIPAPMIL